MIDIREAESFKDELEKIMRSGHGLVGNINTGYTYVNNATKNIPYHLIPARGSNKSMLNAKFALDLLNAGVIPYTLYKQILLDLGYSTGKTGKRACIVYTDEQEQFDEFIKTVIGKKENNMKIKKVVFNNPATIVFWEDGTKTVVKAVNEPFDPEKGLAMAIAKKFFGNSGSYYNEFKKWLPEKDGEKHE